MKVALRVSISAVMRISSRCQVSTVIVPEMFFNSSRTFLPAGKWRETRCCADAEETTTRGMRMPRNDVNFLNRFRVSGEYDFISVGSSTQSCVMRVLELCELLQQINLVIQSVIQNVFGHGIVRIVIEPLH